MQSNLGLLVFAIFSVLSMSVAQASESVVGRGAVRSDPAAYPAACKITVTHSGSDGDSEMLCSGTLIAGARIATAGHCFLKSFSLGWDQVRVQCGGVSLSKVVKVELPEDAFWFYSSSEGRYIPRPTRDVAILTLAYDSSLPFIPALKDPNEVFVVNDETAETSLKKGTLCYIAGYGTNTRGGQGVLYTASLSEMAITVSGGAVVVSQVGGGRMQTSAEHGDSGGSLICETETHVKVLIGVTVGITANHNYNYFAPAWTNSL